MCRVCATLRLWSHESGGDSKLRARRQSVSEGQESGDEGMLGGGPSVHLVNGGRGALLPSVVSTAAHSCGDLCVDKIQRADDIVSCLA